MTTQFEKRAVCYLCGATDRIVIVWDEGMNQVPFVVSLRGGEFIAPNFLIAACDDCVKSVGKWQEKAQLKFKFLAAFSGLFSKLVWDDSMVALDKIVDSAKCMDIAVSKIANLLQRREKYE